MGPILVKKSLQEGPISQTLQKTCKISCFKGTKTLRDGSNYTGFFPYAAVSPFGIIDLKQCSINSMPHPKLHEWLVIISIPKLSTDDVTAMFKFRKNGLCIETMRLYPS